MEKNQPQLSETEGTNDDWILLPKNQDGYAEETK
jgi:hypothetical protein